MKVEGSKLAFKMTSIHVDTAFKGEARLVLASSGFTV